MKNKYNTRRRKKERLKHLTIGTTTLVGIVAIAVSYISLVTPIQAQTYQTTEIALKHATEPELTLQEHVYNLLTEEGGLSVAEAQIGMSIVTLESRWDKYAIGDNGQSVGLWQIHKPSHPQITTECRIDVYCSTRYAIKIYKTSGWYPWSTYKLIQ